MTSSTPDDRLRESDLPVYERAFAAVQKVQERLERAVRALDQAQIPYAIIGGHAVAAWVATIDDGAVRNTRDVDLLLCADDLGEAAIALEQAGFSRDPDSAEIAFLDGPHGRHRQGIHVLVAGESLSECDSRPAPHVEQSVLINGKRIIDQTELVRMKLCAWRCIDQVHLRDMMDVGLIDSSWPARFSSTLATQLQQLLDDPHG